MFATRGSLDVMSVAIRNTTVEDSASIHNIAVACGIDAWTADQYRDETNRSDAIFLIAAEDSEIVGFIVGRSVPGTAEGLDGEVYNIAVLPQFRGRGIGQSLLENALKHFRTRRCRSVWLEVRASNVGAIYFYEINGFTRITIRRNFYSGPVEDAIVMRLTLEG